MCLALNLKLDSTESLFLKLSSHKFMFLLLLTRPFHFPFTPTPPPFPSFSLFSPVLFSSLLLPSSF